MDTGSTALRIPYGQRATKTEEQKTPYFSFVLGELTVSQIQIE